MRYLFNSFHFETCFPHFIEHDLPDIVIPYFANGHHFK